MLSFMLLTTWLLSEVFSIIQSVLWWVSLPVGAIANGPVVMVGASCTELGAPGTYTVGFCT